MGYIQDGSLLQCRYFTTTRTAEFNYHLSEHTKQYLSVNSCPVAASLFTCFTGDSSNRTVTGRLQHTTKAHTLQQSISLPSNTGPQDHTAQQSVSLASPCPTALDVHHYQSHYLTCFTAACPTTTIFCNHLYRLHLHLWHTILIV
jgi:hypothetical protein